MKFCTNAVVSIITLFLFATMPVAKACPTCLGNLDIDTPPLFSAAYEKQYALHDDGTLDIPTTQESADEKRS